MRGSKHEIRPGVWRLRVYIGKDPVTGKHRHASRTFHGTAKQADTALARFVAEVSDGDYEPSTATLNTVLTAFCDHSERIGRSPTTVAEYRRLAGVLKDGIGTTRLTKLTPSILDELYAALGNRGTGRTDRAGKPIPLSAASVNRYHDFIKAACRQAVKWGWLKENPAVRATPPTEHSKRAVPISPAELRALIENSAKRGLSHAVLIALAAMTGGRRGELVALRWSDIDLRDYGKGLDDVDADVLAGANPALIMAECGYPGLAANVAAQAIDKMTATGLNAAQVMEGGILSISRAIKQVRGRTAEGAIRYVQPVEGPTKTHADRKVALALETVVLLIGWRRTVEDEAERSGIALAADPFLFSPVADYGRPYMPDTISTVFGRVAKDSGLACHLHQLRHFAATQMIGQGTDVRTVAHRLGHADPSVTLRVYADVIGDVDRAAAAGLAGVVAVPELPGNPPALPAAPVIDVDENEEGAA